MKVKTGVPTLYCMQPKQWSTLPLDTLADIGSKSEAAIARSKYVSYVFDGRDQLRLHGFGCWKAIYIVQPLIMAIWCNMSNPFQYMNTCFFSMLLKSLSFIHIRSMLQHVFSSRNELNIELWIAVAAGVRISRPEMDAMNWWIIGSRVSLLEPAKRDDTG